jgi:drug/metabolite transporter (DMT)-like permease
MLWGGAFFAADLAFWHYAIHYTSVANSTVLSNLTPVLVTAVGWLVFRERPRALFLLGMAVAIAGALAMGLARHGGVGPGNRPALGDALSALTAVWYGAYFLAVRRARATASAAAVMLWTAVVGAPLLLLGALAMRERLVPASALGWAACAGLGLVHVSGQGAIAWALGRLPVSRAAVAVLVQPVVAAVLGWGAFGEALTGLQALGGAVALAGVALAQAGGARPAPAQGEAEVGAELPQPASAP